MKTRYENLKTETDFATLFGLILGRWVGILLAGLVLCYPLMLIWNNCLVPAVTVLMDVTWSQMLWIYVMSKFLCSYTKKVE